MRLPSRWVLPIIQMLAAVTIGGYGLWQRHAILNSPSFFDGGWWNSSAAYHVWPKPFKFAVVANFPAFITGAVASFPFDQLTSRPDVNEFIAHIPVLLFVFPLWYWVGRRLDARPPKTMRMNSLVVFVFMLLSVASTFVPGYVTHLPCGLLLWLVFTSWLLYVRQRDRSAN